MKKWCVQVLGAALSLVVCRTLFAQCLAYEELVPDGDPIPTYGNAIAIDGDWAAIGASQDYNDNNGVRMPYGVPQFKTGSVFMRRFENGQWVTTQKIHCPNRNTFGGDEFGRSIALQGTVMLIGAPLHEFPGGHRGATYLYRLIDSTWTLVAQLTVEEELGGELFGYTVAIDGDIAAIGAIGVNNRQGRTYVYERTNEVWTRTASLTGANTGSDDRLGSSLAIQGETILAGAPDARTGWGAAWIFEKVNGQWVETASLQPSDPVTSGLFGLGVCLNGDEALVSGRMVGTGRVYVYLRRFGAWQETESYSFSIYDPDNRTHRFGQGIAVEGDTALISAPQEGLSPGGHGAAYFFYRLPGGWTQGPRLAAPVSDRNDAFADTIAMKHDTAWVRWVDNVFGDDYVGAVELVGVIDCTPTLEVTATCPEGGPLRIDWENATPGGFVALFFSPGVGEALIPPGNPCAGVALNLNPTNLELFYMGPAGADGARSLHVEANPSACGGYMQLLNISTCRTSNVSQLK